MVMKEIITEMRHLNINCAEGIKMRLTRILEDLVLGAALWILAAATCGAQKANWREQQQERVAASPFVLAAQKHLKTYRLGESTVEAGFVPEQSVYVWGEPIHYFAYLVRNASDKPVSFIEGGDDRGGRSESNRISAVDENGKPVAEPRMWQMGGMIGFLTLQPGRVELKLLPVDRRLIFAVPGKYTVTGRRTLALAKGQPNLMNLTDAQQMETATSFTLTILPYTAEAMGREVTRIENRIRDRGDVAPQVPEHTEPNELSPAMQQELDLATLTGIKDETALDALTRLATQGPVGVRAGACRHLGERNEPAATALLAQALGDADETIRVAAADGLGRNRSKEATAALQAALPKSKGATAGALIRALGTDKSADGLVILRAALTDKDLQRRKGTVDGLAANGGPEAISALKTAALASPDLELREAAAIQLGEKLRQDFDPFALVDVVRSREGGHTLGRSPTLMRLYGAGQGTAALIACLDFNDPSIRHYYNWALIYEQAWGIGGMRIPWISDLNRDTTPEEKANNERVLASLKAWLAEARRRPTAIVAQDFKNRVAPNEAFGEEVDGLRVAATTNQPLWPAGMPQFVHFQLKTERGGGGEGVLHEPPAALEIELNGRWHRRTPPLIAPDEGIAAGSMKSFQLVLLDQHWRDVQTDQPFLLAPGVYTTRVRLSRQPADKRTGLATSKAFTFEILGKPK